MTVTFAVADVEPAKKPLHKLPSRASFRNISGKEPEACADLGPLVEKVFHNGFLSAVHLAFDQHYPLVLSPDAVWLCIAQGLAAHVNAHAEELRHFFVAHEGKEKLSIRRDDFVKGRAENPWPEVLGEFSRQIQERIGKKHDLIVSKFSTTGPIERTASEIVLMDAVKQYFTYEMRSMCGIPSITLEGTATDWKSIRTRAQNFSELGCDAWLAGLLPILDKLVLAADGRADAEFFQTFCKKHNDSGGPRISGWINALFPYVKSHTKAGESWDLLNPHVVGWKERFGQSFDGPEADAFPSGLASAPFRWEWPLHGKTFEMEFLGGFIGVAQDDVSLAVRPAIGWAVVDRS